ncbi:MULTISPECIES: Lrp/AsnC family transcriptional regulator [Pseudoclavibacter]|jgi:Lrp/AsnC family leucine-responsive transcriptional regulator|uniref:Lrp/AsnC family transcriptional regulator n=1 Tax=Pseudoclavibacter terrae TaxID=1530195 RepID=A0A7J5B4E6_9MICO|nr:MULTISPECIES: Lrp/AsnC family transcriptional regulator [Pseudoclavibacter]KAB1639038.1 Lrp/AsnC family transcriptional regulator [Pseudoclavibacter terrae]PPG33386.1 AsnC family transcriptional regulator [Pseudoclavibacter sp. RFBB5]PPG43309.1 AsnC family transcriptional regulator [Pseudoclavibacter sp. RFBA6]
MTMRPRDEIDAQILRELTKNARIPLVALGNRVRLSRNAVKQRIERLERDGVIEGYTLVRGSDADTHDHPISAVLFVYRADRMRGADVLATLAEVPEVIRCDILTGDYDLFVLLEARSVERIKEVWESIAAIPGVKNTVTSLSLSTAIRHSPPAGD